MQNESKKLKASNRTITLSKNLAIELKTISVMAAIYCNAHHIDNANAILCTDCLALVDHAEQKLDRCVYGESKPACKKCPIHCYKPERREQARLIMRYAGPKMLFKHPVLAIKHLIKETKS
ncbi:nitrous oxide-stimulated promoter family protein, partial [Psychromonas sp.]|nr:nitrous oxide-stimulated promoter family protein [Psychromonas sp.]